MGRRNPREQQAHRDIERARTLVSRRRGLSAQEAADALHGRATEVRVSLHAAALAVLATSPIDELLSDGSAS